MAEQLAQEQLPQMFITELINKSGRLSRFINGIMEVRKMPELEKRKQLERLAQEILFSGLLPPNVKGVALDNLVGVLQPKDKWKVGDRLWTEQQIEAYSAGLEAAVGTKWVPVL